MSLVTVGAELLAAKERLSPYKNNITVFGSARIKSSDPYIKMLMSLERHYQTVVITFLLVVVQAL